MSKVSVLIAVYNTEKYLAECLDSVCSQTLQDIQIICIDDCSTDSSPEILQRYAAEDSRLHIIRMPENSGQAVARNKGLQIADGEYIMMLDSDDWLSSDAIEKAVVVLDSYDDTASVLFDMVYHDAETGNERPFASKSTLDVLDGRDAMRMALDWDIHGLYLARRHLYEKYPFDTAAFLYSDDNTARRHYLHSGKVRFCDGIYYYFQRPSSLMHNPGVHYADWMEATASLKRMLVEEGESDKYINHIEARLWQNIVAVCGYYWRYGKALSPVERASLLGRIESHHAAIELRRLPLALKCKFGFIPFKRFFGLFMLQERLYFYLRKLVKGI